MRLFTDVPMYLKTEILVAEIAIIIIALYLITIDLNLLYSLNYMCLIAPSLLLVVGAMGFLRDGVDILPKGSDVLHFKKIYVYNPLLPFIVAMAIIYIYYEIGAFLIPLFILSGTEIARIIFLIFTLIYFFIVAIVLIFSAQITVVSFEGDEIIIKRASKEYRALIKDVKIATDDLLREFGVTPKEREIYISTGEWSVLIKNFRDEKAFSKFHSYIYYRLNPNEYLNRVSQKTNH